MRKLLQETGVASYENVYYRLRTRHPRSVAAMADNNESRDAMGVEEGNRYKQSDLHPETEQDIFQTNQSESDANSGVDDHPTPHFSGNDRELKPTRVPRKSRRHSTISQELEVLTKSWGQQDCQDEKQDSHHTRDADNHASRSTSARSGRVPETAMPSQASQKLAESNKLEDQINLQHLVELMRIFHVSET